LKVSVIVPVFNADAFLREALDSVLAQTYSDWECVCIDDGSTDGSAGILDAYAARDGRIRILHQANAGVSTARNAGLGEAQGEFVAFLDPDDLFHPQCVELALAAARERPGAVIVWNWQRDDARHFAARSFVSCGDLHEIRAYGPCVWNKLYPREALEGIRFCPAATVGEDIAFLLQVAHRRKASFVQVEPVLSWYRERSDSAMHRPLQLRDFIARSAVIEDMVATLSDDPVASRRFCREELPGLLKQFLRHLRQVVPVERSAAEYEFSRELRTLRKRGLLWPQRGSFKDLKYYLRFLLMSIRVSKETGPYDIMAEK